MADDEEEAPAAPATNIPPECPHCGGDITAVIRRVEGATWRHARKRYQQRRGVDDLADRVDQLERALVAVLSRFTGQAAPVPSREGEKK